MSIAVEIPKISLRAMRGPDGGWTASTADGLMTFSGGSDWAEFRSAVFDGVRKKLGTNVRIALLVGEAHPLRGE